MIKCLEDVFLSVRNKMRFNDTIEEDFVMYIKDNVPEAIYEGVMYRYCEKDRVNKIDYVSFSKSEQSCISIIQDRFHGFVNYDKLIMIQQESIGIDLIACLRYTRDKIDKSYVEELDRLIKTYKEEYEVIAKIL